MRSYLITDALEIAVLCHPRYQSMVGELSTARSRLKQHKQEVGALHRRINELTAELLQWQEGECLVSRPGEGTYECDPLKPCGSCAKRLEIEGLRYLWNGGTCERDLLHERDALKAEAANCKISHDLDAETIAGLLGDVERLTADNAALVEALTGCGELCHADGCEGSHDWDTDDSDDCTCGATPINLARRAALAPIRNRKEPTND